MQSVLCGDSLELLKEIPDNSIDSIVTDPPYELGFMGKGWDSTGIAYNVDLWCECLRVLKPGGHLLAFSGTRTYHRMACAIEDAGFEIRDMIEWLYLSGFPKSMDVGKQFDKMAGAEREVVGESIHSHKRGKPQTRTENAYGDYSMMPDKDYITAPTTDLAKQWDGWGTALKPAHEPIVMARKPIEKAVAYNVEKYGTGAVNVDGCRITMSEEDYAAYYKKLSSFDNAEGCPLTNGVTMNAASTKTIKPSDRATNARFPANCITLDTDEWYSKYFNVSPQNVSKKASKKDRGEDNVHPTVKPTDLMAWLVRLVTPPGGIVLDSFAGSGSTLVAAKREGFSFIGIEMDETYCNIIHKRLGGE